MQNRDLFPAGKLDFTLRRLCQQLIEHYRDFDATVLLGLQPRGIYLGRRIQRLLAESTDIEVPYGELDVTYFRDDFRRRDYVLEANKTRIDFLVENKRVILIDDVLYTGRTVRAALDAMLAYGRPRSVELLVLVDRLRQRELPVEASYVGVTIDTIATERVIVRLSELSDEPDTVFLTDQPA